MITPLKLKAMLDTHLIANLIHFDYSENVAKAGSKMALKLRLRLPIDRQTDRKTDREKPTDDKFTT